jgi:hypothetical protein
MIGAALTASALMSGTFQTYAPVGALLFASATLVGSVGSPTYKQAFGTITRVDVAVAKITSVAINVAVGKITRA